MRTSVQVRYSECDMQRVVHNSVYLRWSDDVADGYFRALGATLEDSWWDVMVKAASLTWSAPARVRDVVDLDLAISRFGTTSFDLRVTGTVDGADCFEATITYVCVRTGTLETVGVPDEFRARASAVG